VVGIYRYGATALGISNPKLLFWYPLDHISETNRARKLKFGTLVCIGTRVATTEQLTPLANC